MPPLDRETLHRLTVDSNRRVSDYFEPHDTQMIVVNRGDLRALLDAYLQTNRVMPTSEVDRRELRRLREESEQ